ncbi:hypothetical protein [Paenibacillus humicola]|nr:hypothetical protein [Paenibacillus humicola]
MTALEPEPFSHTMHAAEKMSGPAADAAFICRSGHNKQSLQSAEAASFVG